MDPTQSEGLACPIVQVDRAGEKIIGSTRCPVCSSYYDITYEKQNEAAKLLERGMNPYEVQYIGDSLWKVTPKKRGAITEFLTAKTLIDRARARQQAELEPQPKRRRRKQMEVPLDSGEHSEPVGDAPAEELRSDTDKRRRKQRGAGSDGGWSGEIVRGLLDSGAKKAPRKKAKTVRQPRKRVSQSSGDNGASKASLEPKRRRGANKAKSSRTRRRD